MDYQNRYIRLMMKYKRHAIILFGNLIALLILMSEVRAQDTKGYIYGRVTTFDNQYQGQIRWGKEEAFWNDYFNATKIRDDYYEGIRNRHKDDDNEWDFDWGDIGSIWENKYNFVTHEFKCQFGDIKSLSDIGRSEFTLTMKNGVEFRLEDGSNDFGGNIILNDDELGRVSIKWNRIERIDFMSTPSGLDISGGAPLYGTVETARKGTFVGFIQWDHDERLGDDILDGDTRGGDDLKIPFRSIEYIEREGNGSIVILKSGREFYLDNSNDVDNGNRGIIVTVPGVGKIDIPWKYFRNITFEDAPDSGPAYDEYEAPKGLIGTVYTLEDDEISGNIVYDIDEAWEIETLDGNDDDVEYRIAFRHIQSIVPKNYDYSMIELRNGDQLLLGGSRDVSDSNDGLLVFERGNDEPTYIPWRKVAEIAFD